MPDPIGGHADGPGVGATVVSGCVYGIEVGILEGKRVPDPEPETSDAWGWVLNEKEDETSEACGCVLNEVAGGSVGRVVGMVIVVG